jgi:hypothetical protein
MCHRAPQGHIPNCAAWKISTCCEFGLGDEPSSFPDYWLKHLIWNNDFNPYGCIDNVHNGTSLASISADFNAGAPANGRGIT